MTLPPILSSRRMILVGGGAALLLAGCGAVGPVTRQIYVLKPTPGAAPDLPKVRWQLVIAVPDAAESLDTPRIALARTPDTLDYYADAEWSDRVPLLLQDLLIEAFEASGKLPAVAGDTAGLRADFLLQTVIREFDAFYESGEAPPNIVVRFGVRLVSMPARAIVGSLIAEQRAMAASNNLNAIVAAFDQALGAALTQVVEWTLRTAGTT